MTQSESAVFHSHVLFYFLSVCVFLFVCFSFLFVFYFCFYFYLNGCINRHNHLDSSVVERPLGGRESMCSNDPGLRHITDVKDKGPGGGQKGQFTGIFPHIPIVVDSIRNRESILANINLNNLCDNQPK